MDAEGESRVCVPEVFRRFLDGDPTGRGDAGAAEVLICRRTLLT
jgi:hypothetical protein